MSDLFPPGSKWFVRDTPMNRRNDLQPGAGVYITWVDQEFISVESLQPGMPSRKVPRPFFGANFTRSLAGEVASAYVGSRHADVPYVGD